MNLLDDDLLGTTLVGLETGLRVRHITTLQLETCTPDADVAGVLSDPHLITFECIPVRTDGIVIGYVQRAPSLHGIVREQMQPIRESVLVSADLPLTQFIPLIPSSQFRLVLDGATICGIVTWSDLQKLPIRVYAFSLITKLELVMGAAIRALYAESTDWLSLLSDRRREGIERKLRDLQQRRLEPALLELTDFCDKREILAKRLHLGRPFRKNLEDIEELRNTTAHAGTYAESAEAVRDFVACLGRAEHWIGELGRLMAAVGHQE